MQIVSHAEEVCLGLGALERLIDASHSDGQVSDDEKATVRAYFADVRAKARGTVVFMRIGFRFWRNGRIDKNLLTEVRDYAREAAEAERLLGQIRILGEEDVPIEGGNALLLVDLLGFDAGFDEGPQKKAATATLERLVAETEIESEGFGGHSPIV
jgi:hypothetical protein